MNRYPTWKTASILGVCLLGLLFMIPSFLPRTTVDALPGWLQRTFTLGLDLQGGSQLLLEVDLGPLYKERLEDMVNEVRGALRTGKIGYRGLGVQGDAVVLSLTDPTQLDQALEVLKGLNAPRITPLQGGLVRDFEIENDTSGRITLTLTEQRKEELATSALTQSLEVVRRRIDELGTRETSIQRQGSDRILVQVPGERNPENLKRLLGKTARLTFQMVDMQADMAAAERGQLPAGSVLVEADEGDHAGIRHYVLKKKVELSGENLVDAQTSFQDNQPVVSFRMDNAGARKFGMITQENVGQLFAIVLDDKVISAPRIREPILGGSGVISGNFTVESANDLAVLLRSGALPAPLKVVEERTVGAELGADSVRAGIIASFIAAGLVVVFMLVYYGIFGVIADIALVANLVLLLGIMSLLQATLTLPGIAGIVLTIGAAVDSNVLIYERIREEQRSGKTPFASITSGFDEALRTIIDANLTTLIAALVLFQFGSGPVKGFAVTLGIGIATTMFTAVTFSRLLVNSWYWRARPAHLPL
ncbi:MAG: protein translocase subunit SecD [Geminicoccaceae bacterium]